MESDDGRLKVEVISMRGEEYLMPRQGLRNASANASPFSRTSVSISLFHSL